MNGVRVKLCGMRTADDVDAAVAAGADAVGVVVLSPRSTRNLDPATARRLVRKVAPDVSTVMVTASTDAASLLDTARAVGPDAVQVPATTGPKALEALAAEGLDVWLATRPVPADEAMALFDHADAIVLDAVVDGYGGTGDRLDEASAATVVRAVAPRPVVLAGGLTPANVSDAIAAVRPWAVDVSSGIETDGIKDPDLMQAFVNAVRGAGSP